MALAARVREHDEQALVALARARQQITAPVLAHERALPVLPALAPLLPEGLRRGSAVAVEGGAGATTLAVSLVVAASAAGSWVAVVGAPWLGLQSMLEQGVVGERLLLVPEVPRASWATVVAALVDAVDVVVAAASSPAPGEVRRLAARARERGAVIVALPGTAWPGADVRLSVGRTTWTCEHRRLEARRAEVAAGGRGAAARPRTAELWLPGPDGRVA